MPWAETKRFTDLPFQCYPVVFWPYEMHPEGPFTENIREDFAHTYAELRYGLQAMERGDLPWALRVLAGFLLLPLGSSRVRRCLGHRVVPIKNEERRTRRCTEWRPRDAGWQFGSHGGAAIGELNVENWSGEMRHWRTT